MDKSQIVQLNNEYQLLKEELLIIQENIRLISKQLNNKEILEHNSLYRKLISLRITAANLRIRMGKVCCSITKSKATYLMINNKL